MITVQTKWCQLGCSRCWRPRLSSSTSSSISQRTRIYSVCQGDVRPRRNPLRNSVSSNDAVCRTELGEEATKTRVKTDTAEPLLPSDVMIKRRRISSSRPGSCLEPTSGTGPWSSADKSGMTLNFATLSVQPETPLSRADWKKSDKSLSSQPPSSRLHRGLVLLHHAAASKRAAITRKSLSSTLYYGQTTNKIELHLFSCSFLGFLYYPEQSTSVSGSWP